MKFHFSKHLTEEIEKRKLPQELIKRVLQSPGQKAPEVDNNLRGVVGGGTETILPVFSRKWRSAESVVS